MADQKISELTEKTTPIGADLLAIVDTEASPDETKKVTLSNLLQSGVTVCVTSGTSIPASPSTGEGWYNTNLGVLFRYSGSAWTAVQSFGAITFYVDGASGTDDLEHGHASGASAFATNQYAIDQIPGLNGGNVSLNISGNTYTEDLVVEGKNVMGNYTLTMTGTLQDAGDGTLTCTTGSVQGTGATQGTVECSTSPWTTNEVANKLVRFTSGVNDGITRLIDSNDANTLTICGTWPSGAPASGDSFVVEDWATIVDSIEFRSPSLRSYVHSIKCTGANEYPIQVASNSYATCYGCWFTGANPIYATFGAWLDLDYCYSDVTSLRATYNARGSTITLMRTKFDGIAGQQALAYVCNVSYMLVTEGSVLDGADGTNYGIYARGTSLVVCYSADADGLNRIRNCDVAGVRAELGGQVTNTSDNVYSGNTTDESADAASFGYID